MRIVRPTPAALALAAQCLLSVNALAQEQPELPPVLETPGDPPLQPFIAGVSVPASARAASVQVNVNGSGQNILNDAANEPSIAIDPTAPNRMVIGWRQFDNKSSNFRQAGYAYTRDGGRTWTFPGKHTPGTFRSDPVLDADNSGRIYYYSLRETFLCDMFLSDNAGQTWTSPIFAQGGDKAWLTVDKTGGVGEGNVYISWSTAAGCCGSRIFTRSTDGGLTYMNPITLPNSPVWGTQAVGPDGTLYIVGMDFNTGNVHVLRSTNAKNAGQTPTFQGTQVNLGGVFTIGGSCDPNPAGLWGQLWIDVDRSGGPNHGNVYVAASVDPSGTDPLDVRIAISTDGGVTFPTNRRINDDSLSSTHYQWFGTMSVAPDGRLDVIWNDSRESNVCNLSRLYYSSSTDGGLTWAANTALSNQWNSYIGWPNQDKIGDYYDMQSDLLGADLAWAATFNGEQDVYYLRIGERDCNANAAPDSDDITSGGSRDCDANGIPDECDIAAGLLADANGDGIADICACPADCNNDGSSNTLDVLCFLNLWAANDPAADCNDDGSINTLDVLCFLNLWTAGC